MKPLKILLVDFDGVIHSYASGWQGADKVVDLPVNGAIDFLREAVKYFAVCIYSARSNQEGGKEAMQEAIRSWDNNSGLVEQMDFPTSKPPAFLTIDDRCIQFTGIFPTIDSLLNFKVWNAQDV
jgi:hypothetical protein